MKISSAVFSISSPDYRKCPSDGRPEYAFIGRSNVGKSSLINMLTGVKGLAKTSGRPGKTQLINHFLINNEWYLVDLPGYGYARVSKAEAEKLVSLGDTGAFDGHIVEFGEGFLRAKAIDDRVGCAVMLALIEEGLPVDCRFAFTVQEEVGCRGAAAAAFRLRPEICLGLEGTTAADLPSQKGSEKVCAPGKGPVLPFMDGGSIYDRGLWRQLTALAEEKGIPWQTKTWISGGSDASAIQKTACGARVAAISAAVRYIHSPSCVGCTEDFENMPRLARAYLETL